MVPANMTEVRPTIEADQGTEAYRDGGACCVTTLSGKPSDWS